MNTLKRCSTCSTVYTSDLCPRCLAGFADTPAASSGGSPVPDTVLATPPSAPVSPTPGARPAPLPDTEVRAAAADPRNRFGKYVLLRQLGAGGMGVVFKAWQNDLRRVVAIKFIRGIQAEQELERFQREAQLAATLSHPGIAPIFESGVQEGKHYFAMQYVEGLTLDRMLAGPAVVRGRAPEGERPAAPARPPLRRIMEILAQVADAVDFAHEKGVVHRDLKPANIMVDARGHAYVMDFGLAKSVRTGSSLTGSGHAVGTPSYMAPEQAQGDHKRIGPRTDVYALGAILYEVAASRPPFVGENLVDVLVDVAHTDPVPPRKINPKFPTDLETIALKALEKDPERRFATAADFAADLRRWLEGEPILARPSGQLSRLFKRVRRHKLASAGVLAILVGLAVAGLTLSFRAREKSTREKALPYFQEASTALERADLLLVSAIANAAEFDALLEAALRNGREAIRLDPAFADAYYVLGRTMLRRDRTQDQGLEHLGRAIQLNPMHLQAYLARGVARLRIMYEKYGPQHTGRRSGMKGPSFAFNPKDPEFEKMRMAVIADLQAADRLGSRGFERTLLQGAIALTSWRPGQDDVLDRAEAELGKAVKLSTRDPMTYFLLSRVKLARGRFDEAAEKIELAVLSAPNDGFYLYHGACVLSYAGRHVEALKHLERVIEVNPDNSGLLGTRGNIRMALGETEKALADYRRSIELDPAGSASYTGLAYHFLDARKYEEALKIYNEGLKHQPHNITLVEARVAPLKALKRFEEAEADMDRVVAERGDAIAYSNRGAVRSSRDRFEPAMKDFEKALQLSPDDPDVLFSLGVHFARVKKYDEAEPIYRRAMAGGRDDGELRIGLAYTLFRLKRYEEALVEYREASRRGRSDGDPRYGMGECLYNLERWEEAAAEYREAIRLGHPDWHSPVGLGECLFKLGRYEEALPPFQEGIRRGRPGPDAYLAVADCMTFLKRWPEAEEAFTKALERQKDHFDAFTHRGRARCELGRLDEALKDYLEALRIKPDEQGALWEVALIHYHMKNLDEALAHVERSIAAGNNTVQAHGLHGDILRRLNEFARADESYTRALKVDPKNVASLVHRSRIRHQLGRKAEGYADIEAALKLSPDFPAAIGQRGILLVIDKRYAEAAKDLRRALEMEPGLTGVLKSYLEEAIRDGKLKDDE